MRYAFDGDLSFLHDFKQGSLGLGGRPVDFIGQEQLREHRAASRRELAAALVIERVAGDVRRHQVGRELDARIAAAEGFCQRPHQQCLAEARHAFDEYMATGEKGGEHLVHRLLLPDHCARDLHLHRRADVLCLLQLLFRETRCHRVFLEEARALSASCSCTAW